MVADTLSYLNSTQPNHTHPIRKRRASTVGIGLYSINGRITEAGSDYFQRIHLGNPVGSTTVRTENNGSTCTHGNDLNELANVSIENGSTSTVELAGEATNGPNEIEPTVELTGIESDKQNDEIAEATDGSIEIEPTSTGIESDRQNDEIAQATDGSIENESTSVADLDGTQTDGQTDETTEASDDPIENESTSAIDLGHTEAVGQIDEPFRLTIDNENQNNNNNGRFVTNEIIETIIVIESTGGDAAPTDTDGTVKTISNETTELASGTVGIAYGASVSSIGTNSQNVSDEIREFRHQIQIHTSFDPFRRLPQPFSGRKRANSLFETHRPSLSDLEEEGEF